MGPGSGWVAGCGSEGCLGFGWAGRGQECGRSRQAARTRIHTREEAAELSRARARGKRKGWARIDAGDLVLRFQGLGLKNQVNWQQGDSGHGGMRQNLNDGPWECSGMGPSPGRWRPFHPGQQLPTSCPSPQVSPKPSPTSCLKAAADSVMSLLSSPEPSRPGHSQARTRRLGQTEPGGLGSDLGTGLQLAHSSAGATLISDTRPPTGTPLKDTILGWAGDQSLSTEIHVGVTLPSRHAPKGSHAPHTPGPPLEPTSLCSPVSWTPVATPGSSSAGTSPTDRSLPQAAPRLVL